MKIDIFLLVQQNVRKEGCLIKSLIFAHRGASKYAPENTMPAFQLALELNADGIETDIQLTQDGVPILIHDETLKRTTGAPGYVKDYPLAEIKKLDAGKLFSKKFTGTRILTLEEFLKWASQTPLVLNLELKNNKIDYDQLEIKVIAIVEKYNLHDRVIISSFNDKSVKRAVKLTDNVEIALLRSRKHSNLSVYAKQLGAHSLHINYRLLNKELVQASEKLDLPLRVYTVNRRASIVQCLKSECDGLISDVPDKAVKIRKRYNTL